MIVNTKAAELFCMIFGLAVFSIESAAADSAKEVAALQAVDQTWVKAYNAGDVDTLASLYDEHAVLLPPGAPAANGRAAIRAFLAKDTAESAKAGVAFSLGPKPAGGVSGDMGWQSGTYVVKDKSGKAVDTGKYLSVSMKKGGKWLYVRDTWNSDVPLVPAENPAPPKK
jgi:uncharacterized protein (TIGR02246 family)